MAEVLHELEDRFDLVIIDAPPLLPVTDAAVLASLTSGALLVVRYGKTRREQVRRAVEALRAVDANIYGVVLNMAPAKGPDAYYYGYAYRYDYRPTEYLDLRPASHRRVEPEAPEPEPVPSVTIVADPEPMPEPFPARPQPPVYQPTSTVRVHPPTYEESPPQAPREADGPYYPMYPANDS
jgi:non-specific protein-tyrosine kinase